MQQAKYRVEAFIIPVGNDRYFDSALPKTDDAKITDKLKINEVNGIFANNESHYIKSESYSFKNDTNDSVSTQEESIQNLKNSIVLEGIINESCIKLCELKVDTLNKKTSAKLYPSSSLRKIHTLMSIDENNEELDEKLTDLCYHGCKNGCSATVPAPQEVSENVFKENWLQKLETIKQKEAGLKNKEIILQSRERALFKREREVRIMERLLKDKLRQLDLRLKRNKYFQDTKNCGSQEDTCSKEFSTNENLKEKLCNMDSFKYNLCIQDLKKESPSLNQDQRSNKSADNEGVTQKESQEKISTCGSSCSSDSNISEERRSKHRASIKASSATLKSSQSKLTSNSNNKIKRSSKIYYDDLDTTLSADIGDSSFVQTSQKFNPELYTKPYAFTRSASERHVKRSDNRNSTNSELQNVAVFKEDHEYPIGIEQDKILKRVTENISVSQDKSTKFQHYGLIDQNVDTISKAHGTENDAKYEKRYSYLNLETNGKLQQKIGRDLKDRPMSWNEGTNVWLQKKRQAYKMTTKRMADEDFEDKENFKCNTKIDKVEKLSKKKDIKNKIFTIFR